MEEDLDSWKRKNNSPFCIFNLRPISGKLRKLKHLFSIDKVFSKIALPSIFASRTMKFWNAHVRKSKKYCIKTAFQKEWKIWISCGCWEKVSEPLQTLSFLQNYSSYTKDIEPWRNNPFVLKPRSLVHWILG